MLVQLQNPIIYRVKVAWQFEFSIQAIDNVPKLECTLCKDQAMKVLAPDLSV